MTRPRKALISLEVTPYHHITSRCVRRAFLCGVDHYSGQRYEHRKGVTRRLTPSTHSTHGDIYGRSPKVKKTFLLPQH